MYFCEDVDLLAWEPSIFHEDAFAHQALFKDAPATLTGTALVMGSAVLGDVDPGMVAQVTTADDSVMQLLEITAVADATHATVSAVRGRAEEPASPPLMTGSVKVTVVTFRPQIAAVGDGLLALIGVNSDRENDPDPATADLSGFRNAAIFGTLAAVFRTLCAKEHASTVLTAKQNFYAHLAPSARRAIAGKVDLDGDGTPETYVQAAAPVLERW